MFDWKLISSDSHVVEPPDLWTERMDRAFRDRGPRVISEFDGDWWMIDGTRGNSFQGGAQVGKRFEHAEDLRPAARFSEVRPGAYQPAEFLRENEEDGIWGSVIYPTAGLQLSCVPDLPLLSACFRAYNDWLVDFCRAAPERLRGIALINVEDVDEAIRELTRARKRGLAGGMITVAPAEDRSYDHKMYEPFWAAAQDLDAPISLHVDDQPSHALLGRREQPHVAGVAPRQRGLLGARVAGPSHPGGRVRAVPAAPRRLGRARARVGPVLPRSARLHVHAARAAQPLGSAIAPTCFRATSSGGTPS